MARHPRNHDEPEAHEGYETHETHHDSRFAELAAEVDALARLMGQPGQVITEAQLDALVKLDIHVRALAGLDGPAGASQAAPGAAPEAAEDPAAIPAPEA